VIRTGKLRDKPEQPPASLNACFWVGSDQRNRTQSAVLTGEGETSDPIAARGTEGDLHFQCEGRPRESAATYPASGTTRSSLSHRRAAGLHIRPLGEGPRSGGTGRREEEKGESRGDIKLGQGQRYWRTVGGGEHDFWEKRRGRRRTHAPFFNIEIVFSRNQAHEILLNLSHLLVHSIKVLEIRAEPRKKKKGDDSPCRRRGRRGWPRCPRRRRGRDLTGDRDVAARLWR
jgi:hypothetical protein